MVYKFCCCYSDEDDGDTLDWLPMAPEIEDPEEPGWGQLEVKQSPKEQIATVYMWYRERRRGTL